MQFGRRISGVLVATALLAAGISPLRAVADVAPQATVESYERPDAASAKLAARLTGRRVEVTDARSETETTWANPDGTMTTDVASGPIRVRRNGDWAPLDLTLEKVGDRLRPVAAAADVSFTADGTGPLTRQEHGGRSLSLGWKGTLPVPEVSGGVATYRDVQPGADLVLSMTSMGFTEHLVLRSRPATAPVLRFPVTGKGLALARGRDGDLTVKDPKGALVAQAPTPLMWDASIDARSGEHGRLREIPTEVVAVGSGSELVLSPPASFFDDPDITYPVTVDPVISLTNVGDTWVQNDYTTSQSADPWLKVGTYDAGAHVARSLIKWSTTSITDKHVLSATMSLYEHWSYSCTGSQMSMGPVNAAFGSGTVWTNQPTYTGTYGSNATFAKGYNTSCPDGRQSLSILPMVDAWADGTLTNNGLKLWGSNESDSNGWKKFCSANVSASSADAPCTTTANVPTMSVTYNSYPNIPSTASPANASYTNDTTPTMQAKVTDPDGGSLHGVFYLQDVSGPTWVANGGIGSTVASGGITTYTRSTALTSGHTYQWKLKGNDNTDSGVYLPSSTTWYTYTIDTTAPNLPTTSSTTYVANQWGGGAGTAGTFAFGNGGSTDVVGYYYGLDDSTPGTYTTATSASITPGTDGPHHVFVQSKDRAGNRSAIRDYAFNVGSGAMTAPIVGDRTQKRFTVQAAGQPSFTSVKFQFRRADADAWADIANAALTWADGTPLTTTATIGMASSASTPVVWDVPTTLGAGAVDGPVQVRASFSPSSTTSAGVVVTLDRTAYADYAADEIGPGSVNMVTGNLTISETDVSVLSAGSDLAVSRTYQSRDPGAGSTGMFGAPWASTANVASANSEYGTLTVSGNLVSVATSDGDTIAFAKKADGTFTPEIGAGGLTLSLLSASDTYTLVDRAGNTTTFAPLAVTAVTASTTNSNTIAVADPAKVVADQRIDVKNGATVTAADRKITAVSGSNVTFDGAAVSVASGASVMRAGTYFPSLITQPGTGNTTGYSYDIVAGGVARVTRVLAPKPASVTCPAYPSTLLTGSAKGCRALEIHYATTTTATGTQESAWGDYAGRVASIGFVAWDPAAAPAAMAEFTVARYAYDNAGRLRAEWDPRLTTPLKTVYDYDSGGHVTSITPASSRTTPAPLAPWTITYATTSADANPGRVATISRTSSTTGEARTTLVYGVALTGSGAPYELGSGEIARWAQRGQPVDGAAVFETSTACGVGVATLPTPDFGCATLHYPDVNGREVNTASRAGGGIDTTEYDAYGNIVRRLTAANRARALDDFATDPAAAEAAIARTLDEQLVYSADGERLLEMYGPAHQVELAADGRVVDARAHTVNTYDEGAPSGSVFDLVTTSTTGARETGTTSDVDVRTSKTAYDWTLRQPTATTTDAVTGGLNLVERATYNASGRVLTLTHPRGGATTNTAQTTAFVYYTAVSNATVPACGGHPELENLPCQVGPAAQPGTTDMPSLPVTTFTFNAFDDVLGKVETAGATTRTTTVSFDAAGRAAGLSVTGGVGTAVPDKVTVYDPDTGAVDVVCQPDCGSGNALIDYAYDDFGRQTSYADGAGVTSTTTYDVASRPVMTNDGKGSRTRTYDQNGERRGVVTQVVDSTAGTFGAAYDLDGFPVTETYPNGIVATTNLDATATPTQVTYDQPGCGVADCTWFTDNNIRSVHGNVLTHTGLSEQHYAYDGASRLTGVDDVADGICTRRSYILDSNANRTQLGQTTYTDDSCTTVSSTTTRSSYYDAGDRLYAESPRTSGNTADYGYDTFGRVTRVPAAHAALPADATLTYYADDLVRSVASGSTTRTWTPDPAGRPSGWTDGDPANGPTHVNHYTGETDSPAWTSEVPDGSEWTRAVPGAGRALAFQSTTAAGTTTSFVLTNLHGDATLLASSAATAPATPLSTFDSTEFGTPRAGVAAGPRYGWSGHEERSADTVAGFVLMGVRLYLPTTGMFLQPDPVFGGGTTPYSFADGDPVNNSDLSGRFTGGDTGSSGDCKALWAKAIHEFTRLQRRIYEYNQDPLKLDTAGRRSHLKAINQAADAYENALRKWKNAGCSQGYGIEKYIYKRIPRGTPPKTVPYPIHPPVDPFSCHHI
jgi:RHS repeat-associated protein